MKDFHVGEIPPDSIIGYETLYSLAKIYGWSKHRVMKSVYAEKFPAPEGRVKIASYKRKLDMHWSYFWNREKVKNYLTTTNEDSKVASPPQ